MSAKKETYISFILDNIKRGVIEWKENVGLFEGKFGLKEDTFNKYWKIANEAYKIEREAIQKEKAKEAISLEIETAKTQIYDKAKMIQDIEFDIEYTNDLLKKGYILKKFTIDGNQEVKKEIFGVKEIESLNRIKDSKYDLLKKLQGWESPKKIEQKNLHELVGLGVEYVD